MVHRSMLGSMERLFAHLIEVHGGAFPAWCAPVQVVGAAGRARRRTAPPAAFADAAVARRAAGRGVGRRFARRPGPRGGRAAGAVRRGDRRAGGGRTASVVLRDAGRGDCRCRMRSSRAWTAVRHALRESDAVARQASRRLTLDDCARCDDGQACRATRSGRCSARCSASPRPPATRSPPASGRPHRRAGGDMAHVLVQTPGPGDRADDRWPPAAGAPTRSSACASTTGTSPACGWRSCAYGTAVVAVPVTAEAQPPVRRR